MILQRDLKVDLTRPEPPDKHDRFSPSAEPSFNSTLLRPASGCGLGLDFYVGEGER